MLFPTETPVPSRPYSGKIIPARNWTNTKFAPTTRSPIFRRGDTLCSPPRRPEIIPSTPITPHPQPSRPFSTAPQTPAIHPQSWQTAVGSSRLIFLTNSITKAGNTAAKNPTNTANMQINDRLGATFLSKSGLNGRSRHRKAVTAPGKGPFSSNLFF